MSSEIKPGSERLSYSVGILITVLALFWCLDLPIRLSIPVYTEQFLAVMIGLSLFLAYSRPAVIQKDGVFGWLRALAGLGVGIWLAIRFPVLQADMLSRPVEAMTLASLLLLLLLDACRRSAGIALVFVFGFFLAYGLAGHQFSGVWQTKNLSFSRLFTYTALDGSATLGISLLIASSTVLAFMFFGRVLQACGGGEFFTDISTALFGRYRGGSGKVEVVASLLFGSISGSAVANVMSTGVITIPNMKRAGYRAETTAAIEAVSSTGGQIMPPVLGAAAFLMAENLQVSYMDVALAALIPALLFYVSIFIQVDFEAVRRKIGGLDPATLPKPREVMRQGWFFLLPFFLLFWLMFQFNLSPEEALLLGIVVLVPFAVIKGYGGQKLSLRGFFDAVAGTGKDAVDIIIICAVAGGIIGLINITSLSLGLGLSMVQLTQGNLLLLLVAIAVICVILGMGLPTTGVYLLVAVLAAPPLIQLGVNPMAAHMFVFYFGCLSMITPPVAMAAYAAAHIAKAGPMQVGWIACMLGWPAFVLPFVFAYTPELLMIGKPLPIVMAVVTVGIAVWLGCAAFSGYLYSELSLIKRLFLVGLALVLLLPASVYPQFALLIKGGALLIAVLFIAFEMKRPRAAQVPSASL
ncbi:MAG: TRAP transporter fused permease subunit [Pseudomonadota bacterium]